jgi:hypothetical protein
MLMASRESHADGRTQESDFKRCRRGGFQNAYWRFHESCLGETWCDDAGIIEIEKKRISRVHKRAALEKLEREIAADEP